MSSLKFLSLARNGLNSSLQDQGLCQLNKLQELDLNSNFFQGIVPPCLNNLTSLRNFLQYIQFLGEILAIPSFAYEEKDEVEFVTKNDVTPTR
ncbi:hypothetical protein AAG906_006793 [Vitis piasezkii]